MTRVACIDIGTVTARLAVADVEGGHVVRLAKRSQICNLGQDVDKTHRLRQDAMERVFGCVAAYLEEARRAGATSACCTLTSAARDAQNARELGAALASLGLEPMVIPGAVEGSLTFLGVAQDFVGHRILVADNGGGSTELAMGCLGTDGILELDFVRSVDVGCRRLTERFLAGEGPAAAGALLSARELAGQKFAPVIAEGGLRAASAAAAAGGAAASAAPERLVVCGGTVTTMVAVKKALDPYDPSQVHLATLCAADVQGIQDQLASLSVEKRAALPGIQPKRAPVILGGVCAVAELMAQTGFDQLTVSERDLLFGLSLAAAAALERRDSPVIWKPEMRPLVSPQG